MPYNLSKPFTKLNSKKLNKNKSAISKSDYVCVKESVFPFDRFPGEDIILGPEMKSTGEVMGIDKKFPMAFLKSQMAAGNILPSSGSVFISVRDEDKENILFICQLLEKLNYKIYTTKGTSSFLTLSRSALYFIHSIFALIPTSAINPIIASAKFLFL